MKTKMSAVMQFQHLGHASRNEHNEDLTDQDKIRSDDVQRLQSGKNIPASAQSLGDVQIQLPGVPVGTFEPRNLKPAALICIIISFAYVNFIEFDNVC